MRSRTPEYNNSQSKKCVWKGRPPEWLPRRGSVCLVWNFYAERCFLKMHEVINLPSLSACLRARMINKVRPVHAQPRRDQSKQRFTYDSRVRAGGTCSDMQLRGCPTFCGNFGEFLSSVCATLLHLWLSSLHKGHTNHLCIVPCLIDVTFVRFFLQWGFSLCA